MASLALKNTKLGTHDARETIGLVLAGCLDFVLLALVVAVACFAKLI